MKSHVVNSVFLEDFNLLHSILLFPIFSLFCCSLKFRVFILMSHLTFPYLILLAFLCFPHVKPVSSILFSFSLYVGVTWRLLSFLCSVHTYFAQTGFSSAIGAAF
jgi:hypothetical protein